MEITYFNPSQDPSSKTVADFGLSIPELDITFFRVKLIRSKSGHLFVAAPSFKENEEYKPYWSIGESKKRGFNELAMQALKDYHQRYYGKPLESLTSQEEVPF